MSLNIINGKTIFSWNVPAYLNGNPYEFAKGLFEAGFEGVCLKGGDGINVFKQKHLGPWPLWGENIKDELVTALRKYRISVYIWHYIYGVDPIGELQVANNLCSRFKPDGYIWNPEGAFDSKPNAEDSARFISKKLNESHPNISQGLCWWALPKNPANFAIEWHPIRVAKAFLETVDVLMPMVYWMGRTSSDAISYLTKSLSIWETIGNFRLMPIGRAYIGDSGSIDPLAITAFANNVDLLKVEINIVGISWWSLDHVHSNYFAWDALKRSPKFVKIIFDPNRLPNDEKLNRLVSAHKDLFPDLFIKDEEG